MGKGKDHGKGKKKGPSPFRDDDDPPEEPDAPDISDDKGKNRGMPPSDDDSEEEEEPMRQNAKAGMMPPSTDDDDDDDDDDEDDGLASNPKAKAAVKALVDAGFKGTPDDFGWLKEELRNLLKPKPKAAPPPKKKKEESSEEEEEPDPAVQKRLAEIKKRREAQAAQRIAADGWDRMKPMSADNHPPGATWPPP